MQIPRDTFHSHQLSNALFANKYHLQLCVELAAVSFDENWPLAFAVAGGGGECVSLTWHGVSFFCGSDRQLVGAFSRIYIVVFKVVNWPKLKRC